MNEPDGICLTTFTANDFVGLFSHPLTYLIIDSRSA